MVAPMIRPTRVKGPTSRISLRIVRPGPVLLLGTTLGLISTLSACNGDGAGARVWINSNRGDAVYVVVRGDESGVPTTQEFQVTATAGAWQTPVVHFTGDRYGELLVYSAMCERLADLRISFGDVQLSVPASGPPTLEPYSGSQTATLLSQGPITCHP